MLKSNHITLQTVTVDAVGLWADRAIGDFDRKVGKNAPPKQKAGWGNFKKSVWMVKMCV